MKENKQKKVRFTWITHIFDFGQKYSIEGKDKHKLIYNSLFVPLMISHITMIVIISILSHFQVINVHVSPIFPTPYYNSAGFFVLFSVIPELLYVSAFLLFFYDLREQKEEEKNKTEEKDHLKLVLFLIFLAVIIQFIILLFFYL